MALDTNFNTGLVVLHPDYQADAIPLKCPPDSLLWVYVVAPVDLAVSKIKRFVEIDREDIRKLAEVQELRFKARVPEMADRIIAATAVALEMPLITCDHIIRASGITTIW